MEREELLKEMREKLVGKRVKGGVYDDWVSVKTILSVEFVEPDCPNEGDIYLQATLSTTKESRQYVLRKIFGELKLVDWGGSNRYEFTQLQEGAYRVISWEKEGELLWDATKMMMQLIGDVPSVEHPDASEKAIACAKTFVKTYKELNNLL